MFCPLLNDECNSDCILNNGGFNDRNCLIKEGLERLINNNLESDIRQIRINTETDQTDSSYINSKLDEIKSILLEIKKKKL